MMEIHGSIQFKLDKNAYRMIPLANSEDYLYNRGSLQRQREVRGRGRGRTGGKTEREREGLLATTSFCCNMLF